MRKIGLTIFAIVMIMGCMVGCNKVEMTETDKERIEYVKETLLGYGMEIQTEVTQGIDKENNKDKDNMVSLGKNQLYEVSCVKQDDQQMNYFEYLKFENSKAGKEEAQALFNKYKSTENIFPDSKITEATDEKTGNKSYVLRTKLADSTETSDITDEGVKTIIESTSSNERDLSVILIYDAGLNEVGLMINEVKLPSNNVGVMSEKEMADFGWTYINN